MVRLISYHPLVILTVDNVLLLIRVENLFDDVVQVFSPHIPIQISTYIILPN